MKLGAGLAALAASGPSLAQMFSPASMADLPPHILPQAMAALARHRARLAHTDRIGIVDFSRPSSAQRFFVVDLATGSTQPHLVAHGRGSDPAHTGWTRRFSNEPGSFASSAGSFVTGSEYHGHHGRSMRLSGLDAENCNAESRAIVVHAAWYVSPEIATSTGMLGRSEGCFAVSSASLDQVLDRLGPGRLLYAARGPALS
jgi:L,D-transpeptidase catalytic domain